MKRCFRVAAALSALALSVGSFTSCGGKSESASSAAAPKAEEKSEKTNEIKADAISTVGPDSGTHLELWTFVDLHSQHYAAMLEQWNK